MGTRCSSYHSTINFKQPTSHLQKWILHQQRKTLPLRKRKKKLKPKIKRKKKQPKNHKSSSLIAQFSFFLYFMHFLDQILNLSSQSISKMTAPEHNIKYKFVFFLLSLFPFLLAQYFDQK